MEAEKVVMFLNGTAMSGQRDHRLVEGARFLGPARTAPRYRFYAVRDEFPGLVPVADDGASIVGELYEMALTTWRDSLLPGEPTELDPAHVELEDGSAANVMVLDLGRVAAGDKLVDISPFGGWRAYLAHLAGGDGA